MQDKLTIDILQTIIDGHSCHEASGLKSLRLDPYLTLSLARQLLATMQQEERLRECLEWYVKHFGGWHNCDEALRYEVSDAKET